MFNVGEQIVGQYLELKEECEYVQYNVNTISMIQKQGEIDVVGIDLKNNFGAY